MNCKDCAHYEACNHWLKKEKKHLNCDEGFICEHFKSCRGILYVVIAPYIVIAPNI